MANEEVQPKKSIGFSESNFANSVKGAVPLGKFQMDFALKEVMGLVSSETPNVELLSQQALPLGTKMTIIGKRTRKGAKERVVIVRVKNLSNAFETDSSTDHWD